MESSNRERRKGFLFVGNHLILDLLNTKPALDGTSQELLTDWQATMRWFQVSEILKAAQAESLMKKWDGTAIAEKFTENLRQFREDLRKLVITLEAGKAVPGKGVEELNRLSHAHRTYVALSEENGRLSKTENFDTESPQDLFSPLVRAASDLLVNTDFSRLRQCENCVLHFYDTSKNATRRWCSMQLCGNRTKVAAYAQRRRSRDTLTS